MKLEIDKILKAQNLSVTELSEKLGVTRQTVYRWKKGSEITRQALKQLEALGYIEIEIIPEQVIVRISGAIYTCSICYQERPPIISEEPYKGVRKYYCSDCAKICEKELSTK